MTPLQRTRIEKADYERLDVYNGLLLAPHVDALFDGGWVTFLPTGAMLLSDRLPESALGSLGLQKEGRIAQREDRNRLREARRSKNQCGFHLCR